jgi:oxysterol-binding protein 1
VVREYKDVSPDERTREALPYLKDPKNKVGIWTVIKDSIGKDLSRISLPVYFNDPTSII